MIRIRNGLDLPIENEPQQVIEEGPEIKTVGLVGDEYIGMKPTMAVAVGDRVKQGQLLFTDKRSVGVRYTSPACDRVQSINRGAKRKFQSLVIELDDRNDEEEFRSYRDVDLTGVTREQVQENLIESGLWSAFRTRPFNKVPDLNSVPHSIFVPALDTHPLAARPDVVLRENERDFVFGLQVIRHLTDGRLFLIKAPGTVIPGTDLDFVTVESFDGPHPAGLPGTHIHFLDPVSDHKTVWFLNYQDVIAIGKLFVTGRLSVERVISLAGPSVSRPRLLRTRLGACGADLVLNELEHGNHRIISGSVLSGRTLEGNSDYLGRYHLQVSALAEGNERLFMGWQRPDFDKFSVKNVFASAFTRTGQRFRFTTSTEGSKRAMVPIGMYERVTPLDILPTFLLRALITGDTEQAQALGCLELDEEDLSLCTFVCPGKHDYGPLLRRNLTTIEQGG